MLRLTMMSLLALCFVAPAVAEETPRFEVVVLGTAHAPGMFLSDQYTPGHIRATLELARPDVVAVESHPEWFAKGRYHVVTYEAEGVAVPWARAKGLPVYGVDWKDIVAWDLDMERHALMQAHPLRGLRERGDSMPPQMLGWYPRGLPASLGEWRRRLSEQSWERLNSKEYGESRYRGSSPDDPDFAQQRDREIAANIVNAMKAHPGKRIAVVIGAHHKPFLEILFRKRGDVRVLTTGKDVPFPDATQVEKAWTESDLVCALGHLLDAGSAAFHAELVDLPRARRLLGMLRARDAKSPIARYCEARILMHEGKHERAGKILDGLHRKRSKGTVYPFAMREWRMRFSLDHAVRIEKARLLVRAGEREKAATLLAPVRRTMDSRIRRLEKKHPPATRRIEAVKDAKFESGGRASDYYAGWYACQPTGTGRLAFTGDEAVKAEGERSLRLDVLEPARYAYGFHVRQEVKLPPSERLPDRLDLSLRLRGEKLDWVRFEIVPAFPTSGAPLATRVVNLEPGEWTRAELSLPIPPRLEFGFVVRFNGPVGARLWLDDASPLPVTYDTVHEEWPRLVLARAFLDTLLDVRETAAAASEPERERVASAGLRDPGFEDAPLEANPNVGWSCHAASTGEVDARFDLDQKLEGRRSLMLRVKKPRALGRHFLSRILPPPAALSDEREGAYSVALRAETKVTAVIAIGYWADGSTFHTLAQRSCRLEPRRWARHEVRFQIPPEARSLGLYVYLPNEAGDRVWVDAVRLERVK